MKPDDLAFFKSIGVDIDPKLLYCATTDQLVALTKEKIEKVIDEIERDSKVYSKLGEDGISSIIASSLNGSGIFVVKRETNSRGHVDLTITAPMYAPEHVFRYLGEAKVWSHQQYCIDGFAQLMGYLTGRQKNAFTIIYFRIQSCDEQFKNYVKGLLNQKGGSEVMLKPRFGQTLHTHQSGALVDIDHFAVHLPL